MLVARSASRGNSSQTFSSVHGSASRRRFAAVAAHYEARRDADGRLPATCEIVYGHAWRPDGEAPARGPRETVVPLASIRRRGPE